MAMYYDTPYPPRRPSLLGLWPWLFVLAAVGFVVWFYWPARTGTGTIDPGAAPRLVTPRGDLAEDEKSTIQLVKEAAPSVVSITTVALRRDGLTLNAQEVPEGSGSGFVWDVKGSDALIVTNYHVIQGIGSTGGANVTLDDNSTWKARVVGGAPDQDLAVLRITLSAGRKLRPLPIGTSNDLQVGQKVFAIGNPYGLDQTLTTGVISALNRQIKSVTDRIIKGVIQTDAAINPGNSGGPLLDSAGRLIGVNTAIYSPSGGYAGIGFAIPVDTVNRIVPQLIAGGRVERAGLGIHVASDAQARRLKLPGVLVLNVEPNGPAAKAGLRPTHRDELGDVILAIDDKPVTSVEQLLDVLEGRRAGDTVRVKLQRGGVQQTVDVVLAAL